MQTDDSMHSRHNSLRRRNAVTRQMFSPVPVNSPVMFSCQTTHSVWPYPSRVSTASVTWHITRQYALDGLGGWWLH